MRPRNYVCQSTFSPKYFTRVQKKRTVVLQTQMSFFFSKKVFKCQNCNPATDKQRKSERKDNQNILEVVAWFSSCISSSLEKSYTELKAHE